MKVPNVLSLATASLRSGLPGSRTKVANVDKLDPTARDIGAQFLDPLLFVGRQRAHLAAPWTGADGQRDPVPVEPAEAGAHDAADGSEERRCWLTV